jgi:hypothetical protein
MSNLTFKPDDISTEVWMGVGGVMLVLLRSIIDGTRRTALQLLAGCVFGGLGAMAAGFVWGQSHYVYLICGVAAVVTENIVIGCFNMSQQFASNPRDVIGWFIQTVLPAIPLFRAATAKTPSAVPAPSAPAAPAAPAPVAPAAPPAPVGPVVQSGEPNG